MYDSIKLKQILYEFNLLLKSTILKLVLELAKLMIPQHLEQVNIL